MIRKFLPPLLASLICLLLVAITAVADARTWTSSGGGFEVEADLVSVKGNTVSLRSSNGKIFEVPLDKLSPVDQQFIRDQNDDETTDEAQETRSVVPDASSQQKSLDQVREIFADKYAAARTPEQKNELASELFQQAERTADDPIGRYVLLAESQRLAIEGRNAELFIEVVQETATLYQIDSLAVRAKGLVVLSKARSLRRLPAGRNLLVAMLPMIEELLEAERFAGAQEMGKMAVSLAGTASNKEIRDQVSGCNRQVLDLANLLNEAKTAASTLKTNPTDAKANQVAGFYLSLVKNNWERGLVKLVKSDDTSVRTAAERDLANPTDPEDQMNVGNAWWDAQSNVSDRKTLLIQSGMKARAVTWYQKALPGLTSLQQQVIKKRITEWEDESISSPCQDELPIESATEDDGDDATQPRGRMTSERLIAALVGGKWTFEFQANARAKFKPARRPTSMSNLTFERDGRMRTPNWNGYWTIRNGVIVFGQNKSSNVYLLYPQRHGEEKFKAEWHSPFGHKVTRGFAESVERDKNGKGNNRTRGPTNNGPIINNGIIIRTR